MKFHRVTGGGGTHLNVVESGNPKGCPILYIHGLSQCWLQWSRQINSDLAQDHRLVAMDMRGHGLSDKPLAGWVMRRRLRHSLLNFLAWFRGSFRAM
jgi:non-heme chloroperoxidase